MVRFFLAACALVALADAAPASAAEPASGEPTEAELTAQIARELGVAPTGPAIEAPAVPPSGAGLSRLLLLPDISAIGSFAAVHDSYDAAALSPRSGATGPAGKPTFLFQELELGLQAVVDPYARADVFVSFTPEGASIEEAYLTTLGLPGGFQLRAGRLFSQVGRINQTHPHTWDFLDAPVAHDRLVGNEKLGGPGLEASWLAPLPWFAELRLAGQSTAPSEGAEERLTGVARVAQLWPLGDATTLGLGLSAARRDEGPGAFRDLGAVDLLLRVRPPEGRASLTLQAEAYDRRFRRQARAAALDGGDGWGGWAQAVWRRDAWWGYGLRWERAPAVGEGGAFEGAEQRWSAVANWFATEFQRIGLQASHDRRPGGASGWEWLLHLEFVIGAHGAHPF